MSRARSLRTNPAKRHLSPLGEGHETRFPARARCIWLRLIGFEPSFPGGWTVYSACAARLTVSGPSSPSAFRVNVSAFGQDWLRIAHSCSSGGSHDLSAEIGRAHV